MRRPWALAFVALLVAAPFILSDFWLSVLNFAAIAAVGALGLNLLTGLTGQLSLGHAFFLGLGAYTAGYLGGDLGLPVLVWLPAAGILGALVGLAVGPFALRLRGFYLAIVTIALVFLGDYAFLNLKPITGGPPGRQIPSPLDFAALGRGVGISLSRDQWFYLFVVPLLALAAVLAQNVTRSRSGRAFQAIRHRELSAAVIGIDAARYKVAAFGLSSFYAAAAGALFGSYIRFVSPEQFNLLLSIQYVAMIVVGGIGTVAGSILGALFVVLIPRLIEQASPYLPFISKSINQGGLSIFTVNQIVFGLLIVVFLVFEPLGLAGVWGRARARVGAWTGRVKAPEASSD